MGLETELEFERYRRIVPSPKISRKLHSHGSKSAEKVDKRITASRGYSLRSLDDVDSIEIRFSRSRSSSHKSTAYGSDGIAGDEVLKRNPIYGGSEEEITTKNVEELQVRKKIELSSKSNISSPIKVIDPFCSLDKASPLLDQRMPSVLSLRTDEFASPAYKTYIELETPDLLDLSFQFSSTPDSVTCRNLCSDELFSISSYSNDGDQLSNGTMERHCMELEKARILHCQTIETFNDGHEKLERNKFLTLHKSASLNVRTPQLPCPSESYQLGQKARFKPFRRMLGPIIKSKSMRNQTTSGSESGDFTTPGSENMGRNRTLHKSLWNSFSIAATKKESDVSTIKDCQSSIVASSPVYLNGVLMVGSKHGVPYYEFSMGGQEEVLFAKTWKANNAFNWVYTFHSMNGRGTNNNCNNRWGSRERSKEPPIIGQMQVSCFLWSEMKNNGVFDNSMVTEFVLHDIMHARRSMVSAELVKPRKGMSEESLVLSSSIETSNILNFKNQKLQNDDNSGNDASESSTHYPWSPTELHPNSEIAAVVIQIPFEKRESLKEKEGHKLGDKEHLNLLDLFAIDQKNVNSARKPSVKLVAPVGKHGLPNSEEGGSPSSLLDRWRSGGRCDCGGWDMACPIVIFEGLAIRDKPESQFVNNEQPIQLFFEGVKKRVPALTMTSINGEHYSVDFHAQLSKLQAFSTCVAILHSAEASTACELETEHQSVPCSSLKMLLNEEVRFLVGAVQDKER